MSLKLGDQLAVIDGEKEVLGLVVCVNPDDTVDAIVFPADKLTAPVLLHNGVRPAGSRDEAYNAVVDDGVPRVYAYPLATPIPAPTVEAPVPVEPVPPVTAATFQAPPVQAPDTAGA